MPSWCDQIKNNYIWSEVLGSFNPLNLILSQTLLLFILSYHTLLSYHIITCCLSISNFFPTQKCSAFVRNWTQDSHSLRFVDALDHWAIWPTLAQAYKEIWVAHGNLVTISILPQSVGLTNDDIYHIPQIDLMKSEEKYIFSGYQNDIHCHISSRGKQNESSRYANPMRLPEW